ncbi:serine carboxypeptidase S28 family protein [Actinidia rufa]|uniref:Serine carboxypeptidase S28 family protein n=1 Tax=Actinidia rufa TaxID=165716 RepID=A0A7J0ENG3_9ERIC|nr:serine carboxypeptidase S28 family protein [Actinidia rufa]
MELNRAQHLVHNDASLACFRREHRIPNDILVDQPSLNEVAATVRGHDDRILVRTSLIYQDELWFLVSPMLKEVMARCSLTFIQVSINYVRTVLAVDTLMRRERLPFSASDLLNIYTIVRPKQKPYTNVFIGNYYLRLRNNQQPWSRLVESSRPAAQSQREKDKGKGQDFGPSRKRCRGTGASSVANSPSTPISTPELWNPKLSMGELGCRITHEDTSWDIETCLAVEQATQYCLKMLRSCKRKLVAYPADQCCERRKAHKGARDHRQFAQRYYEFHDHFMLPNGPIFLKICGESACNGITNDYISVVAKKFGAAVVSLEHRYYGKSSPFKYLTTENLKYLSSKQALFDLAVFRQYYQESLNAKLNRSKVENPWFVFGISYPGALSAWFHLKFPHLTCGSLASSAVVLAVYNFTEFDQQIGVSAGPECKAALQDINQLVEQRLATNGKALKEPLKIDGDFLYFLADATVIAVGLKENVSDGYQFKFRMLQVVGAILCGSASIDHTMPTQSA